MVSVYIQKKTNGYLITVGEVEYIARNKDDVLNILDNTKFWER